MGSYWAYYELGWGGWWFWDPVENASFMPWLAGTALLHSALVMEKRNALKIWTIFLSIITFSLSLLGTFLVRSGVLTSIHTFASDPTPRHRHPGAAGAVHRRRLHALRAARGLRAPGGRAVRADQPRRSADPQQSVPRHRARSGAGRNALSAGARGGGRQDHLGRRAVLQPDLWGADGAAAGADPVRAVHARGSAATSSP